LEIFANYDMCDGCALALPALAVAFNGALAALGLAGSFVVIYIARHGYYGALHYGGQAAGATFPATVAYRQGVYGTDLVFQLAPCIKQALQPQCPLSWATSATSPAGSRQPQI
jgi:hypothetical protein